MPECTRGLLFSCLANAILGGIAVGYHNCVLNIPQTVIKHFVRRSYVDRYHTSLSQDGLDALYGYGVVGTWSVGALLGSVVAALEAEKCGRRDAVAL